MAMIKNDNDLFEKNNNYVFIISNDIKIPSIYKNSQTDYFAECNICLEYFIPNRNELAHRIRVHNSFYIDINKENKYEIRNTDLNNPSLRVLIVPVVDIYDASHADIGQKNDVHMCDLVSSSFANFVLNESFKEIYKYFDEMDEKFVEVAKNTEQGSKVEENTILNKKLLNPLKQSFQEVLSEFVENFESNELDILVKKYPENVSMTDLKDLYQVIREAEIAHKRKKLYEHLSEKLFEDEDLFKEEPRKTKI